MKTLHRHVQKKEEKSHHTIHCCNWGENLVQPESVISSPERDGEPLEEVAGTCSFPWWDPKMISRDMANAGDGIDCFLAPGTQVLHQ